MFTITNYLQQWTRGPRFDYSSKTPACGICAKQKYQITHWDRYDRDV